MAGFDPFKVVAIGDGNVGKTALLTRFTEDKFIQKYEPTVFDNAMKTWEHNGVEHTVELWDTAGQEAFDRIRSLSYRDTHAFLICFSIDDKSSLTNIKEKWVPEMVHYYGEGERPKFILVGTKCDLRGKTENEEITEAMVTELREKITKDYTLTIDLGYCETSALNNIGITDLFNFLLGKLVEHEEMRKANNGCCTLI